MHSIEGTLKTWYWNGLWL